ncbi:hypothetical protein [Xanthomonas arboricola]
MIKYLVCALSGAVIGAAVMYPLVSPSVEDLAALQASQLQLEYGIVVSPLGEIRPPEMIAKSAKTALAVRFLNVAPLYSKLNNGHAKESLWNMSKTLLQVKFFDAVDQGSTKDYSYVSAHCIASMKKSSEDPLPCLKAASDKSMGGALTAL